MTILLVCLPLVASASGHKEHAGKAEPPVYYAEDIKDAMSVHIAEDL